MTPETETKLVATVLITTALVHGITCCLSAVMYRAPWLGISGLVNSALLAMCGMAVLRSGS